MKLSTMLLIALTLGAVAVLLVCIFHQDESTLFVEVPGEATFSYPPTTGSLSFSLCAEGKERAATIRKLNDDFRKVRRFLVANGFADSSIVFRSQTVEWTSEPKPMFSQIGDVTVVASDLRKLLRVSNILPDLGLATTLEDGVNAKYLSPSSLPDSLFTAAARSARMRADSIASALGLEVDCIQAIDASELNSLWQEGRIEDMAEMFDRDYVSTTLKVTFGFVPRGDAR